MVSYLDRIVASLENNLYDEDGRLMVNANLEVGDIEIGAVEIKDGSSDQRATVNGDGQLLVKVDSSGGGYSEQTENETALTDEWDEVFAGGSNYDSLIIMNKEDPTGATISYSLFADGNEVNLTLKPGEGMVISDLNPLPAVRMKGPVGGEKYELIAWG